MKKLKINNKFLFFDDEDFEKIRNLKIFIEKNRDTFIVRIKEGKNRILLNRIILGKIKNKIKHKDKNPFNFQKKNLKIITEETKKEDKIIWYRKKYTKKFRNLVNKNQRKKYKKDPSKFKQRCAKYRKTKKWISNVRKRYKCPKRRYRECFYSAKKRNLGFEISFNNFLENLKKPCYYCGVDFSKQSGSGLDRIDNDKGYIKENVLPCCGSCNKTRSNLYTVEETSVMIKALLKFRETLKNKEEDLYVPEEG